MPCLYPVECFRTLVPNENGKRPIFGDNRKAVAYAKMLQFSGDVYRSYVPFVRPCGQCIECRLKKSRYIATRCVHEASMFEDNSFLTLTFDNDHFPSDHSLSVPIIQNFWKRLRDRTGAKFKYYAAGEYGDGEGERVRVDVHGKVWGDNPHYHACVFGYDPSDRVYSHTSDSGEKLYTSDFLNDVWGQGSVIIGDVTFESAAYVARYTLKKIYGDDAEAHYMGRLPEKSWSSIGLGKTWFDAYAQNTYDTDTIVIRGGIVVQPPPYYDKLLMKFNPDLWAEVENRRAANIINSKINVDKVYSVSNPTGMNASELVRRAQLRVGNLDCER